MPGYLVPAQQSTNPFTPTGNISSTTVGDAIVELDNEKATVESVNQVQSNLSSVEGVALLGL
jgi:hypothetical protein